MPYIDLKPTQETTQKSFGLIRPPAPHPWYLFGDISLLILSFALWAFMTKRAKGTISTSRKKLTELKAPSIAIAIAVLFLAPGIILNFTRTAVEARADYFLYQDRSVEAQLLHGAPEQFKTVIRDVIDLTPPDATIRYYTSERYSRAMADYMLSPRNIHCNLHDKPRPDYILVYIHDIEADDLIKAQRPDAVHPSNQYITVRKWAPNTYLLQRVE